MRFRSGTLERSVRRWGPRTSFKKFQRVGHSWKYVVLENTAVDRTGATNQDVIITNSDDWALTGTGVGVKNMVVDLDVALCWTPENNVANVFHNASIRWGLFCLDADDVPTGSVDTVFGDTRALRWGQRSWNFQGMNLTTPVYAQMNATQWNFKVRARQRFMKFEEELRFMVSTSTDITDAVDDLRLHIFGRVSWETP